MYHRASPVWPDVPAPTLNVTPNQLERQWVGLRHQGYEFVPLQQLVDDARAGLPTSQRRLAVTFDDGYQNMYTQVLPLVERLKIPVTIFISTEWIGNGAAMHFDDWGVEQQGSVPEESYRPLNWSHCQELHASEWVEVAAHSHSHADFRGDLQRFRDDMQKCLASLEEKLGITNPNFAFPFGRVDDGFATPEMVDIVRELGVQSALTTEPGPVYFERSPFCWGRNNVFAWDTAATIDARLAGWYDWLPRWRRGLRQVLGIAQQPLYDEPFMDRNGPFEDLPMQTESQAANPERVELEEVESR